MEITAAFDPRHAYIAFDGVLGTMGLAVIVEVVRTQPQGDGFLVAGRSRPDLWPEL